MENGWGRQLPEILRAGETAQSWPERRREILKMMQRDMYGAMPSGAAEVSAEIQSEADGFAGKALAGRATLTCRFGDVEYAFPVSYAFPKGAGKAPVFVHVNFRPEVPDSYLPAEEILDNGFGFAQICYKDIVNDSLHGDFSDGLGARYYQGRAREAGEWGKIGMWAYSASRVVDWLLTRPEADEKHIMVAGHSRLGKTALWAGATDERIYATFVNDSGAGGAAITRGKTGEHVCDFVRSGMWDWFAGSYQQWANREEEMPFDSHFTLALIAPRLVCVGNAEMDAWADPASEALACRAASGVWRLLGKQGLVMPEGAPGVGDAFLEGDIGYQLRAGTHFFSRTDWLRYMAFAKAHIAREA